MAEKLHDGKLLLLATKALGCTSLPRWKGRSVVLRPLPCGE